MSLNVLRIRGTIQASDKPHIHLHFALQPLFLKNQKSHFMVKVVFVRNLRTVTLNRSHMGNVLYSGNAKRSRPGTMSTAIASWLDSDDKDWIRKQGKVGVSIYINLSEFGIELIETVLDVDARSLAKELFKIGWFLGGDRLTNKYDYGDLFIFDKGGNSFLFEITRIFGSSFRISGRGRQRAGYPTNTLLGKLLKVSLYAKELKPEPTVVFIFSYPVFPYFFDIVKKLGNALNISIISINCTFQEGWERKIGENLNV